jgi:hypothetical protein
MSHPGCHGSLRFLQQIPDLSPNCGTAPSAEIFDNHTFQKAGRFFSHFFQNTFLYHSSITKMRATFRFNTIQCFTGRCQCHSKTRRYARSYTSDNNLTNDYVNELYLVSNDASNSRKWLQYSFKMIIIISSHTKH